MTFDVSLSFNDSYVDRLISEFRIELGLDNWIMRLLVCLIIQLFHNITDCHDNYHRTIKNQSEIHNNSRVGNDTPSIREAVEGRNEFESKMLKLNKTII